MLQINIPASEYYNEINNEFVYIKEQVLKLEHSLVSIRKWESKWNKPFLSQEKKTSEELSDYIRCMTITQNVNPVVYSNLPESVVNQINSYINAKMTATWFNYRDRKQSREIVTAEIIYYWMITLGIPFECEKWHLNQLLTLIEVCSIKNQPSKKMSRKEVMARNSKLNALRKKRLKTKG